MDQPLTCYCGGKIDNLSPGHTDWKLRGGPKPEYCSVVCKATTPRHAKGNGQKPGDNAGKVSQPQNGAQAL